MDTVIGILGILIVFGLIMGFHEFGHFLVAKLSGMAVHEFSFGVGPALISRQFRETKYSIRLLPFMAYVNIAGMDPEEVDETPNGFYRKPFLAKFLTLLAGAGMNFVLALLVFIVIGMAIGYLKEGNIVSIQGVQPGSPAAKAGLMAGDVVVGVNEVAHPTVKQAQDSIRHHAPPVRLVVERNGQRVNVTITPKKLLTAERKGWFYQMVPYYGIGVVLGADSGGFERVGLGRSVVIGSQRLVYQVGDAFAQFASMVTGRIPMNQISGPVGIMRVSYDASKSAVTSPMGLASYLSLIALLSVFIGFFNLLPFPALDGGRLLFVIIEGIMRRPLDHKKEELVHIIGMMLLLSLVVLVTAKDILSWIKG